MEYVNPEEAKNIRSLQSGCFRFSLVWALINAVALVLRTRSVGLALLAAAVALASCVVGAHIGKRMAIASLGNHLDIKQGIWVGYLVGAIGGALILSKLILPLFE